MKTTEKRQGSSMKTFDFYDSELRVKKGVKEKRKPKNLSNIKSFFNGGNLQESLRMVGEIGEFDLE
jgi:hypothetical protein